jgi:hypothetical protein
LAIVFWSEGGTYLDLGFKKRDILKFKAFSKKKGQKSGKLRILGRTSFKKRDCPAEKCADGQPILETFLRRLSIDF